MILTNSTNIPLSVAVMLATDNYDYVKSPKYISATSLLRPLKALILARTLKLASGTDIADLVPAKIGTAVHESQETAWRDNHRSAMKSLGYKDSVIDKIVINPDPDVQLADGLIPVYLERRGTKQIGDWTIGGKFDICIGGHLSDLKTTKTYSYISGSNNDNYVKQGSIYRWLMPEIITDDIMSIDYVFTDWNKVKSVTDKNYPQNNVIEKEYELLSIGETENFISFILDKIEYYSDKPQEIMPKCTKEELWQRDSVWKYYKDPNKLTRSTKNFDNSIDAHTRNASDGSKGLVVEVKGEVKRCLYCDARPGCLQAQQLEHIGLLK